MDIFYRLPIFYWWLLISWVLVFIFNKITYDWLAMAERGREGGGETENYLIEENFLREKVWGFFFRFFTFFLWNAFLAKIIYPWRKNLPAEKFTQQTCFQKTLIYVKKTFKNDIPLGNSSNYCKNLYRNSHKSVFLLLFHHIGFNRSWKWQNRKMLIGKNTVGEKW